MPPPPTRRHPESATADLPVRVDSISVDVTVVDKQGKPVTDLKQEDFEIRETEAADDQASSSSDADGEARGLEPPQPSSR
jgi:hypothetical protein